MRTLRLRSGCAIFNRPVSEVEPSGRGEVRNINKTFFRLKRTYA
jgi:hypothetical protein